MKIILTGAEGFLGWHLRLRLHALTQHNVVAITRDNWANLSSSLLDADAVIHIAGVNRGTHDEVYNGNITLAQELATAIRDTKRPLRIVYAGTIKSAQDTPYGLGKRQAGKILAESAKCVGGTYVDVVLPNLFGEHCQPHYNSFTATFIDHVINKTEPKINDVRLGLLHAQEAAHHLIDGLSTFKQVLRPSSTEVNIRDVWETLKNFHSAYVPQGDIPALTSRFEINLFNTYRAALFPRHYPIGLTPHSDSRGTFVETVRSHGGEGQTSISTTAPGVTRGEHYHLHKIERFVVVQGTGRIELRRMFTDEVVTFDVDGSQPVAVDMPTGWVHNITNTGEDILLTQFWAHELFRPENPDTFRQTVRSKG